MSNRIGIDLGGTKIDAIKLSETGETLFEKRVATPKSYDAVVAAIRDLVLEAGEGSVGIGSPGSNSRKTHLWRNSNLLFCNGKPFQHDLETAIGRSVRMENDANCFALSEAIDGAGQGYPVVAFFTIGTALGGGLVVNGKLITGVIISFLISHTKVFSKYSRKKFFCVCVRQRGVLGSKVEDDLSAKKRNEAMAKKFFLLDTMCSCTIPNLFLVLRG